MSPIQRRPGKPKIRILFLCTGNAARSQMAEGWARHLKGDVIEAYSAGVAPAGLSRQAVKVMAEAGVDISRQRSKHVDELKGIEFDCVVTLCGHAHETCPRWPGHAKVIHVPFEDPTCAAGATCEEEALDRFRRARDLIKAFVETLPASLAARR